MNFLAHAYLSFGINDALIGNMISDFVKGSSKNNFQKQIQNGIVLHRNIDEFTDQHAVVHKAKTIFKPYYRLYSSPIIDILFDHFLANDAAIFTENSLMNFSVHVYSVLDLNYESLPETFKMVFQFMKKENWLYGYRTRSSMERSLKGLAHRSSYMIEADTAYNLFNDHYAFLRDCYVHFIPDVKQFTKQRIKELFF
jgi:Uncharacterized protein conserved in bacteria